MRPIPILRVGLHADFLSREASGHGSGNGGGYVKRQRPFVLCGDTIDSPDMVRDAGDVCTQAQQLGSSIGVASPLVKARGAGRSPLPSWVGGVCFVL